MGGRSGTVFQLCSSELIFPVETCCQNQKGGGGPCPRFFFSSEVSHRPDHDTCFIGALGVCIIGTFAWDRA